MRIDFSDTSPTPTGNVTEGLLNQVLRQRADLDTLAKILKADEKKDDKKDEKKGMSQKQIYILMLCASPVIGWMVSTLFVMSLLGMKANIDLLQKAISN